MRNTSTKAAQVNNVVSNVMAAARPLNLHNKCNTIKRMYSEGFTPKQIIAETGFNSVTVYRQSRDYAKANPGFNFAEAAARRVASKTVSAAPIKKAASKKSAAKK